MSESPAVTPTEKPWRDMSNEELAVSNLNFLTTGLLNEINLKNPIDDSLKRPVRPPNVETGSMDDDDWKKEESEYKEVKFEARMFDEVNEARIEKLRNKLDALEDEKNIIERGGKDKEELVERYAKAERERREMLEEKSKPKIVN